MADEIPGVDTIDIVEENTAALDVEPTVDEAPLSFAEAAEELTEPAIDDDISPENKLADDYLNGNSYQAEFKRFWGEIGGNGQATNTSKPQNDSHLHTKKNERERSDRLFVDSINRQLAELERLYEELDEVETRLAINYKQLAILLKQKEIVEEQLVESDKEVDRINEEVMICEDGLCRMKEEIEEKEKDVKNNPGDKQAAQELKELKEAYKEELDKLERLQKEREEILKENAELRDVHDSLTEEISQLKQTIDNDEELAKAIREKIDAKKAELLENAETPEQRQALLDNFETIDSTYQQERLVEAQTLSFHQNNNQILQDESLQKYASVRGITDTINLATQQALEIVQIQKSLTELQARQEELQRLQDEISTALNESGAANRNEFLRQYYDGYEAQSFKAKAVDNMTTFADYHVANVDGYFDDINNIVSTADGLAVYRDFESNTLYTLDENGERSIIDDPLMVARMERQAWVEGKPYANECAYGANKLGDLTEFLFGTKKAMEGIDTQTASTFLAADIQALENELVNTGYNEFQIQIKLLGLAQDGYLNKEQIGAITSVYGEDDLFVREIERAHEFSLAKIDRTLTQQFMAVSMPEKNSVLAPDLINTTSPTPGMMA